MIDWLYFRGRRLTAFDSKLSHKVAQWQNLYKSGCANMQLPLTFRQIYKASSIAKRTLSLSSSVATLLMKASKASVLAAPSAGAASLPANVEVAACSAMQRTL